MQEHHYELRNRSRSRSHTPMIINQLMTDAETPEHHYDLRSRESRERSNTPAEVSSSRRSNSRSLSNSLQKSRGKTLDSVSEKKEETQYERDSESEHSGPSTVKKVERRSERQRVKRQLMTNGQGETKDRQSVDRTEQKRKSVTPRRTITSDYSSEEGEREDPPSRPGSAYEIYKQVGDWWNVFPKTDYTYAQTSQDRYEIAPGVLAMPNMSRPSIHSDSSSTVGSTLSLSQQTLSQASASTKDEHTDLLDGDINESIEQNRLNEESVLYLSAMKENSKARSVYKQTLVERFSRQRMVYDDQTPNSRFTKFSQVDSDAELDEAVAIKSHTYNERSSFSTFFQKFTSVVTFLFVSFVEFVSVKILRREKRAASHESSYHRYEVSKWTKLWNLLDRGLQYLYFLLIRVLYFDSWVLSRAAVLRKYFPTRKSKVLWLIFIPPLLLGGVWLLPHAENAALSTSTAEVPKDSIVQIKSYLTGAGIEISNNREDSIMSEEIRKSLAILIERVEKLEAAKSNQGEHISNINQTVDELKTTEKDAWIRYEDKLSNLEEKLESQKSDQSTTNELNNIKLEFKNLQEQYVQLKTCCNKPSTSVSNIIDGDMEKRVESIVMGYLGTGAFQSEIHRIVENVMKAHTIVQQKETLTSEKTPSDSIACEQNDQSVISDVYVRRIVEEILKIYDADKTGRVDYALESAGGQIISIRCTQRYNVNTRAVKVLGFTLFYESGDPRTVIQGQHLQPGVCWAFQDFPGYLLIKLRSPIKVTGFTLEHAPRSILPNNEMKSAPKKFNVWGLKEENDASPIMFGEYEFADNDESLQYFPVNNTEIVDSFEFVELKIHSNHGQLEYTCLYRFRIHGVPV